MRRRHLLRVCLAAGLTAGCGDDAPSTGAGDAGPRPDGGLAACVDRPTDLPRPPTGQLPCELLPPGFSG